jgi:putative tryptophan/tyrosine transport system substrate-binding protein
MYGLSPINAAGDLFMIRRREFIAGLGGAAAWPLATRAQQAERVRRVGMLTYGANVNTDADANFRPPPQLVRNELEKLGWIKGRNLPLDFRFGFGDPWRASVPIGLGAPICPMDP